MSAAGIPGSAKGIIWSKSSSQAGRETFPDSKSGDEWELLEGRGSDFDTSADTKKVLNISVP
jgi:hypothetical protein